MCFHIEAIRIGIHHFYPYPMAPSPCNLMANWAAPALPNCQSNLQSMTPLWGCRIDSHRCASSSAWRTWIGNASLDSHLWNISPWYHQQSAKKPFASANVTFESVVKCKKGTPKDPKPNCNWREWVCSIAFQDVFYLVFLFLPAFFVAWSTWSKVCTHRQSQRTLTPRSRLNACQRWKR